MPGMKSYSDRVSEYRLKSYSKREEIIKKGNLKDSDILEYVSLGIMPNSPYWNMGVKRVLKRAIKLLKREEAKDGKDNGDR